MKVELFDLTMPLFPGIPVPAGDPPLTVARAATHEIRGYEVSQVCIGTHAGTHVEAPRHFFPAGATLDAFPLSRFFGSGIVFDCPEPDDAAFEDSLQRQLRGLDLPAHWIALVRRGGRRLTARAAESLADAGAGLVGVDADSVDDEPHPVHRLLLTRGILIAENLLGLERLGPGVVECCLLPLALTGVDAAPVRAVAWRESRA